MCIRDRSAAEEESLAWAAEMKSIESDVCLLYTSFSRELISMERDGLIRVSGRVIWLIDIAGLATSQTEENL